MDHCSQTTAAVLVDVKENEGRIARGSVASWEKKSIGAGSANGGGSCGSQSQQQQQQQQQRLSNWMPPKMSECSQRLEEKLDVNSNNGDWRVSSVSMGRYSNASTPTDVPIPEYLAREVLKLTVRSAGELEAVWSQVGSQDSVEAKMRVVHQMLAAVRGACEACVKQERDTRDGILANINQAKNDILVLSRKLGIPTPPEDEPTDAFFYGKEELHTLVDKLATLEMNLESLGAQQVDRREVVDHLLEEMKTVNTNMDRQQEEDEYELSGGEEWEGKDGWELSDERVEKLKERLANLEVMKEDRAREMVELVVDCQRLFRQLGLTCTDPLQTKMMMSLDPSSPEDAPSLRTEEQTPTSVGLSVFNVDRLKKRREDMREDRDLHSKAKEEHRQQIAHLWDKLSVPQEQREAHLACTNGITHTDMDNLEAELSRLKKLKGEKLNDMIVETRQQILAILETVGAKAEEVFKESARDLHVTKVDWTEELLESHEHFLALLKSIEERARKIVNKLTKRERLVLMREEFGSLKVDYRARGGAGVQNQARLIDNMKKELKKLPSITDDLRKLLKDWNEKEGFPFRYNGREYLKVIEESDMQWQHRKESSRRGRMNGGVDSSPMNSPLLARRTGMHGSNGGSGSIDMSASGPSSPTRAATAIQHGTFHSTGSAAFAHASTSANGINGSFQRPMSTRQTSASSTASSAAATNGNSSAFFGSPPQAGIGGGGGGGGATPVGSAGRVAGSGSTVSGMGRSGSGSSSSSSAFSGVGTGGMVDSRGTAGHPAEGPAGSRAAAAAGAGGVEGGAGAEAGVSKEPAAAAATAATGASARTPPVTPQKESRNPLLSPFSSPQASSGIRPRPLSNVFASTGGSHSRLPPPPLPARPKSLGKSQALARMKSSPDLIRAATTGSAVGAQGRMGPEASNGGAGGAASGDGEGGRGRRGSGGGGMPPPLPDRPSLAFERADLDAIRESNASSLRSSASASDVLSAGRRTESTR